MDDYHYHRKVLEDVINDHSLLGKEYDPLFDNDNKIASSPIHRDLLFEYIRDCVKYIIAISVVDPTVIGQKLSLQISHFLTVRFAATQKTPGIYQTYYFGTGDDINDVIEAGPCPSFEDSYLGDHTIDLTAMEICRITGAPNVLSIQDINTRTEAIVPVGPKYYLAIYESGFALDYVIDHILVEVIKKILPVEEAGLQLDRMIFQILFTLAVIQDQYPGFSHSNMFTRNLSCIGHTSKPTNRRVYHFGNKQWELTSNGWYAKLDDFTRAYILPIECETAACKDPEYLEIRNDDDDFSHPFTPYDDAWHFLYNLHTFLKMRISARRYSYQYFFPILYRVERLLDMTIIDQLSKINPAKVPRSLAFSPKTLATAKTAQEYLAQGYFDHLSLPSSPMTHKIELHYNQPKT